jgi:hypothetical protein
VTEDENDDVNDVDDDLPPPPPPISETLESFLTPAKNLDNSLNCSRAGFSDKKVRTITQV